MRNKNKNKNKNKNGSNKQLPFVSLCTPTFNRRPFIPSMIQCFNHQTYPKDRMEWIIIDDGTDKIKDLVSHIPQVKYFEYDKKMTLGVKRNLMHSKCKGDYIVYIDDDDYYPPQRVHHAITSLMENPDKIVAGSSAMHIYYKKEELMYQFGPYGPNHATAATFAFKKELLLLTKYNEDACLAEEREFLKEYSIPMLQLDSMKTILVIAHNHNSYDKRELLKNIDQNVFAKKSHLTMSDFIKEPELYDFFYNQIEDRLNSYLPGDPINKLDVQQQMINLKIQRNEMALQMNQNNENQRSQQIIKNQISQLNNLTASIQELSLENKILKDKVEYLENKLKKISGVEEDVTKNNQNVNMKELINVIPKNEIFLKLEETDPNHQEILRQVDWNNKQIVNRNREIENILEKTKDVLNDDNKNQLTNELHKNNQKISLLNDVLITREIKNPQLLNELENQKKKYAPSTPINNINIV